MTELFAYTDEMRRLMDRAIAHAEARISHEVEPLQSPPDAPVLNRALAEAVTAEGLGPDAAFDLFADVIAPNCLAVDNPRYSTCRRLTGKE